MLLDFVIPKGLDRVDPGSATTWCRAWYRATAAWMQLREDHDETAPRRARCGSFRDDPDILFLAACQQRDVRRRADSDSRRAPPSCRLASRWASTRPQTELREAERLFRRTLEVKPSYVEARMRYGRVLGGLGKHAAAVVELRRAAAELTEPELSYHAHQFLGAEEEALGNREAAQAAYERAAALFPHAQSPLLALSQLARRYGDRNGALRAADRLFALQDDPDNERVTTRGGRTTSCRRVTPTTCSWRCANRTSWTACSESLAAADCLDA